MKHFKEHELDMASCREYAIWLRQLCLPCMAALCTVQFVPCKNASFNKALTGFAMPGSCTCPAVSGLYPMVISETFYSVLPVNCPNNGKSMPF